MDLGGLSTQAGYTFISGATKDGFGGYNYQV
jgi:hypothetical protein